MRRKQRISSLLKSEKASFIVAKVNLIKKKIYRFDYIELYDRRQRWGQR